MYKQEKSKPTFIAWLLIGALAGWFLSGMSPADTEDTKQANTLGSEDLNLEIFWDVYSELQNEYIDLEGLAEEDLTYGAVRGLVDALDDPYSVFMTPDETEQFQSSLTGELEGIGAELTTKDDRLVIVSPLKDSPASKAGVLPGDHIFLIDDEPTIDMTLWEAIMLIRGERGTEVTLTMLREGEDEPVVISIVRQKIDIPSLEWSFEEQDGKTIAVFSLYQFSDDTINELRQAINEAILNNIDGLVLDMRLNGGGFLDVSVDLISEFFDDEVKAVIVKRRNEENEILYTSGHGKLSEVPMVVLISGASASASEIVAGALQDHERATVMGTQSFGKGSVQELNDLSDGSSLKLTIAKWYTPADISINDVGVTPDQVIEMLPAEIEGENDIQMDAAIKILSE
ncbi:S41 family peptidase [Candidatus Peregrinibacteria bacterium]|nr:S41 family peptidase [Candidatus Peregrinibacteria bacterium]